MKDFIVPDAIEPVVGWKTWVTRYDEVLYSPRFKIGWIPGEARKADCMMAIIGYIPIETEHRKNVPIENCTCGIYLAKEPFRATPYGDILGEVYGWGKIIEHSKGWRVQYAYPKEIYTTLSEDFSFSEYGVPVHHISPQAYFEMAYPNNDIQELLEWVREQDSE